MATAITSASASTLASYPLAGGRPTAWLRLTARASMNYVIDPADWWRHQGIGYWAVGDCDSCNADGDPFYVIPSPGAHPRLLGTTLADPSLDQVAAAPDGRLAIVAETPGSGLGRLIWQDRRVTVCGLAAAACAGVPSPASAVTLDSAWSPDGSSLVFAQGAIASIADVPAASRRPLVRRAQAVAVSSGRPVDAQAGRQPGERARVVCRRQDLAVCCAGRHLAAAAA